MRRIVFGIAYLHLIILLSVASPRSATQAASPITIDNFTEITWSSINPYPFTNAEAQGIVVKGKFYVFGGYANGQYNPTRQLHMFDPATKAWERKSDMPVGLTHGGFATDGKDIYYASGYIEKTQNGQVIPGQIFGTKSVWRYNVASDTYTALPPLPIERAAGMLAILNNKLHYVAGTNIERTVDVGDHYVLALSDIGSDGKLLPGKQGWITKQSLTNPRHHAAMMAVDGYLYYIAGQHKHDQLTEPQSDVHRYDPAANEWEEMADLPAPRNHIGYSTVLIGRRILVFGGQQNDGQIKKDVFAYDLDTNSWSTLPDAALPKQRHSAVAAYVDGMIYFSQGYSSETYMGIPVVDDPPQELIVNGSFEMPATASQPIPGWSGQNLSNDRVRCTTSQPFFGRRSACAFMFRGSHGGSKAILSQKLDVGAVEIGDTLTLSASFKGVNVNGNNQVYATLWFSDSTPPLVLRLRAEKGSYDYEQLVAQYAVTSRVDRIKVRVKFNGKQGKLYVDEVSLLHTKAGGVIPLPASAARSSS